MKTVLVQIILQCYAKVLFHFKNPIYPIKHIAPTPFPLGFLSETPHLSQRYRLGNAWTFHVDNSLSPPGHCGSAGKESACNAGDLGSIPGLGRSSGEGKGYPLQYSGLENSMDSIVHGVAKSRMRLNNFHFHTVICFNSTQLKAGVRPYRDISSPGLD